LKVEIEFEELGGLMGEVGLVGVVGVVGFVPVREN
jgi:hypothetical protein